MNKKGLDEMQVSVKNKIGSQMFGLLYFLLLFDAGLYGFGFRWAAYPANVMILVTFCGGLFVTRLIKANAYVGPAGKSEKPVRKVVYTMVAAGVVAAGTLLLTKALGLEVTSRVEEFAASAFVISVLVAGAIGVIVAVVEKKQNRQSGE
jgi:hypothetical protein